MQKPVPSSQSTTILEHFGTSRMQLPVITPAVCAILTWDLHEAVVQAEVVTNGVLPPGTVLTVVRELLNDVIINLAQHQHLIGRMQYCHGDESDV